MKKYSILLLSLLTAAACTKENTQDIKPAFNSNLELRAAFDEQSSRLATEDGLTFSLEENKEQIGVYIHTDGTATVTNALYTAGAKDEEGYISFTSEVKPHVQATTKFFAYAPYSETTIAVNGSTEGGVTPQSVASSNWDGMRAIELPSEQAQPAAGVKTDLAKYYAVAATPAMPKTRDLDSYSVDLQFSGVFALVRFGLNNYTDGTIKISKLVFSAENTALTGYFNVDLTHENPKLANTEYAPVAVDGKTFDAVTVTLAEPATVAPKEMAEVYAVVNACSATAPKLLVYATDADGKAIYFEKTLSDKTFTRQQRTAIGVKLDTPIYEEDYAQEVIDALQNGGTVKIEKDVDLSEKLSGNLEIPKGVTVNIEVPAGVKFTIDKEGTKYIENYGVISFSGEGTIESYRNIVRNYGEMTIDGGTFVTHNVSGGTGIYNGQGGKAIINNCDVQATSFALFNENGYMEVNGGTFTSTSSTTTSGPNWAYCAKMSGTNTETIINYAVINGVQGGLSASDGAKMTINDGIFSTYKNLPEETNHYGLYVATDAEVTVNGGKYYREGSPYCVYNGNNDTGTTFAKLYLNGGVYQDQGYDQSTTTSLLANEGYKWVKLETPETYTNPVNGKTNTYYYQIVEGVEDLGYTETENGYEIHNAAGLTWFAEQVNGGNNFSGKTIALTADIDLDGIDWKPIGTNPDSNTLRFNGIFDGQDHTISNLDVNTTADGVPSGLFGAVSGTVKNFKIEHATINSVNTQTNRSTGVAVGVGYPSAKIQNVTVTDATVNAYRQVGGIVGYLYGTVSGCTVNGLTIEAPLDNTGDNGDKVGGIAGFMGGDSGICFDNTVTDAHIKAYRDVGGILGIIYSGSISTFKNNKIADSSVEGTKGESANAGAIVGRYEGTSASDIDPSNTATNVTVIPGGGNEVVAEGVELTPDGEYLILNATGMKSLASLVNESTDGFAGKTITLTENVDLGGEEWTPLGNGSRNGQTYTGNAFKGTFDGNGKTISGLKIATLAGKAGTGLIGILDGGTVKNVTLDVNIDVAGNANELAAGCVGLLTNGGIVENVTVSGNVSSGETAAGIVSRVIKSGTVRNCHNKATINGTAHNIGGIVGAAYYNNEGMTIEGCTNDGAISGKYAVGGIVGFSAADIKNCENNGAITTATVSAGGIIGEQQNSGSIIGCTNNSDITNTSEGYGTGGIVGWIRYIGDASAYTSKEAITVSGNENHGSINGGNDAGGIVGTVYQYGMISENKNYAKTLSAKTFVGGIVGNVQFLPPADNPGTNVSHNGMPDTFHVDVINNYSETSLDNMTGGLKDKFAYTNDATLTTIEGNTSNE